MHSTHDLSPDATSQHGDDWAATQCRSHATTWAIVGAGILVGALMGAVCFLGASDSDEQPTAVKSEPATEAPARVSDQTASTQPASEADLQAERDRLKQQLQQVRLEHEVAELRRQLQQLRTGPGEAAAGSSPRYEPVSVPRPTPAGDSAAVEDDAPAGRATLNYWNRMNAIIAKEAVMRATPAAGVTAGNATRFLEARVRAARFAAEGLRDLDSSGVDPRVVELAELVAGWYDEGREVAETGKNLLTRGSSEQRKGPAGQAYQNAERTHAQNVQFVNAQGEQVRRAMSRKYELDFPPLN